MFCLGPQRVQFSSSSSIKYSMTFISYISAFYYWLSVHLKTLTIITGWMGTREEETGQERVLLSLDPSKRRGGSDSRRLQRNASEIQRDQEICVSNVDTSM